MQKLNTADLENMMKEGKWDKVEAMLDEYLAGELSQEDKGEAYVTFAQLYARVNNHFSEQYLNSMNETLDALRKIKSKEAEVDSQIDVAKVQEKIQKMN
ncbi:MAG: hypothetical protein AAB467_03230 [Patescibacteria group bacterium]